MYEQYKLLVKPLSFHKIMNKNINEFLNNPYVRKTKRMNPSDSGFLRYKITFDFNSIKSIFSNFNSCILSAIFTISLNKVVLLSTIYQLQQIKFSIASFNSKENQDQKCGMKSKYGSITQTPSVSTHPLLVVICFLVDPARPFAVSDKTGHMNDAISESVENPRRADSSTP